MRNPYPKLRRIGLLMIVLGFSATAGLLWAEEPKQVPTRATAANRPHPGNVQSEETVGVAKLAVEAKQAADPFLRRPTPSREPAGRSSSPTTTVRGPGTRELVWPLFLVLAIIIAGTWIFKRWMPRGGQAAPRANLQVLARHYLSNKQSLCVVRLGRRVVFLGVTPDRIMTLADIDDPEEAAAVLADMHRARPDSFTSIFRRFTANDAPAGPQSAEPATAAVHAAARVTGPGENVFGLLQRVQAMTGSNSATQPS